MLRPPFPQKRFRGVYTRAQWPPRAPSQGDQAILADTEPNSGRAYAWRLEYRPDLDGTKPWHYLGGGGFVVADTWANPNSGFVEGSVYNLSFYAPIAGDYEGYYLLKFQSGTGNINGGGLSYSGGGATGQSVTGNIGSTNYGTVGSLTTVNTFKNGVPSGTQFTSYMYNNGSNSDMHSIHCGIRPRRI
jgi:hypothetical protein